MTMPARTAPIETGKACLEEPFGHKLQVYRNPVNLMYGGNQRRGYQYAIERGLDIVVLLHGDGQYAPEVMQNLLTPLEEGKAECGHGIAHDGAGRGAQGKHADV